MVSNDDCVRRRMAASSTEDHADEQPDHRHRFGAHQGRQGCSHNSRRHHYSESPAGTQSWFFRGIKTLSMEHLHVYCPLLSCGNAQVSPCCKSSIHGCQLSQTTLKTLAQRHCNTLEGPQSFRPDMQLFLRAGNQEGVWGPDAGLRATRWRPECGRQLVQRGLQSVRAGAGVPAPGHRRPRASRQLCDQDLQVRRGP